MSRVITATFAAVLAGFVIACGAGNEPATEPSRSATPTPSSALPTPSATTPPITTPPSPPARKATPTPEPVETYYANCSEARTAGAVPIHQGEPGYRKGLDLDGDGIACDK